MNELNNYKLIKNKLNNNDTNNNNNNHLNNNHNNNPKKLYILKENSKTASQFLNLYLKTHKEFTLQHLMIEAAKQGFKANTIYVYLSWYKSSGIVKEKIRRKLDDGRIIIVLESNIFSG